MANSWAVSYVRERPSFEDITLYQLCYWKVTRIYGLTPEEIEDLLTNPDPQTPSHHQVDPRVIEAHLGISTNTVRAPLKAIYLRLGVMNRTELAHRVLVN